jgi:hypothetical protein
MEKSNAGTERIGRNLGLIVLIPCKIVELRQSPGQLLGEGQLLVTPDFRDKTPSLFVLGLPLVNFIKCARRGIIEWFSAFSCASRPY